MYDYVISASKERVSIEFFDIGFFCGTRIVRGISILCRAGIVRGISVLCVFRVFLFGLLIVLNLQLGIFGRCEQADRYAADRPEAFLRGGSGLVFGKPVGFHDIQLEVFKGNALVEIIISHDEGGFLQIGGQVFHVGGAGGETEPVLEGGEITEGNFPVNLGPEHAVAGDRGFELFLAGGKNGFDILVAQTPGDIAEADFPV